MSLNNITTARLLLIPFTKKIALSLMNGDHAEIAKMKLRLGKGWPDEDAIETMPKILKNLDLVSAPTGFESWMIVRKDEMLIIGDVGFKGRPCDNGQVDIGYGIIASERKKGYALEATKGLIDWAFLSHSVKAVTAKSLIANTDSIQILKKLSFTEVSRDLEMINWRLSKTPILNEQNGSLVI